MAAWTIATIYTLACNTAEELERDAAQAYSPHGGSGSFFERPPSLGSAKLTLLPQDAGDSSPACLDGSPYGFYFNPSKTNSTKWTISIEGGGSAIPPPCRAKATRSACATRPARRWCYDEDDCYQRSKTKLGSSKDFPASAGCGCMNTVGDEIDYDCNCLFMPVRRSQHLWILSPCES